eukprot:8851314-Prorocentrum_lima.AAC.1
MAFCLQSVYRRKRPIMLMTRAGPAMVPSAVSPCAKNLARPPFSRLNAVVVARVFMCSLKACVALGRAGNVDTH